MRPIGTIDDAWRRLVIPSLFIIASWMKRWMKPLSMNDDDDANENLDVRHAQKITKNQKKNNLRKRKSLEKKNIYIFATKCAKFNIGE